MEKRVNKNKINKDDAILLIGELHSIMLKYKDSLISDRQKAQEGVREILITHGWNYDKANMHSIEMINILMNELNQSYQTPTQKP